MDNGEGSRSVGIARSAAPAKSKRPVVAAPSVPVPPAKVPKLTTPLLLPWSMMESLPPVLLKAGRIVEVPVPPDLRKVPLLVTVPLLAIVLAISSVQLLAMFRAPIPARHPVVSVYRWLAPFRTFNAYGLFQVMTTTRPEIVIEGSNDGVNWRAYEFRYKPGDVKRRPRFVEPHQPRLDWQMWFTALGDRNPWFANFCLRLLQGSPDVLALMDHNPFPDAPPRYIRAVLYEYHFTDLETRRKTGDWWRRELKGIYLPPVSFQGR